MIQFQGMTETVNTSIIPLSATMGLLFIAFIILKFIDFYNNRNTRHKREKVKNYTPIKFPDNLKLKQHKNQYYLIKNNKRKYLTNRQLNKIYKAYINPFKRGNRDYPTRVVRI